MWDLIVSVPDHGLSFYFSVACNADPHEQLINFDRNGFYCLFYTEKD